jgi:hypothetical protein
MPHVLNYGMGVDSTAILLRWLFEPGSRPFANLEQLIVLTAQTGDEFSSTRALVEAHILPLLRKFQIRFVQVAKHGPLERDGYTVLSDTSEPLELHTDGDYRLSDHLHEVGTVPLYSGPHTCAMKWKGFVIDSWLRDHLGAAKFGPYLGYSADEVKRAAKCEEYKSRGNEYRFPLIEWGWTRQDCIAYIQEKLGVIWQKSCCTFCPYIAREVSVARYLAEPEAAAEALFAEEIALALNPRMQLFAYGRAADVIAASGNLTAIAAFTKRLSTMPWAIYRVERTWERKIGTESGKPFTRVDRRLTRVAEGSRAEMECALQAIAHEHGLQVEASPEALRVYNHRRVEGTYPTCEGFWVVCPAVVHDKVRNGKEFQRKWDELTGAVEQLVLEIAA